LQGGTSPFVEAQTASQSTSRHPGTSEPSVRDVALPSMGAANRLPRSAAFGSGHSMPTRVPSASLMCTSAREPTGLRSPMPSSSSLALRLRGSSPRRPPPHAPPQLPAVGPSQLAGLRPCVLW
jgi:hypothetical protein